ncbi:RNA polymerase sigma factor [Aquimarina mytili]|uniref:Sigma-70 family RNA polymerase sigma factor n=1 Tax=Aquimarina mytili TaxID=874423 RepID=A0A937A5U7_9FLAO|nr:sigma-70 family RNA polymerase sigma factor [Aquimarina mytili]MBL0685445.1 sigma-70 family RNA polymerase sigma factor [Aquimarina mytili]
MNDKTQDTIINAIIKGDEKTLMAIYEECLPQVTSYVMKNSGTEADARDIFQDAMVFLYQKLEENSLELSGTVGGYIYGVCKNMWRNKIRKNKKMVISDDIISISGIDETDMLEDIYENERTAIYQKYFLKLGETCQEVLTLFFSGVSMKEIAEKKGTTDTFIRRKKYKCKKQIIEMIKKDSAYNEIKAPSK